MKGICIAICLGLAPAAANAVTIAFPTGSSIEHTATFDGTVDQANAAGVGVATAGDYVQDMLTVPPYEVADYSFAAPLIDYGLSGDETFDILLNSVRIGGFTITAAEAASGSITGSGSFAPFTVAGPATLRVELTNTLVGQGALGVGTTGHFTFNGPSAVPEPAAWALTLVGFGLIGTALRQRRKPDPAAALN